MRLADHPTVRRVREGQAGPSVPGVSSPLDADWLKQLARDCGADDVGLIERVAADCRLRLAEFKRPHELRIVNELPRATLEKVAKSQLRALLYEERANAAAANLELPK